MLLLSQFLKHIVEKGIKNLGRSNGVKVTEEQNLIDFWAEPQLIYEFFLGRVLVLSK